MKEPGIYLRRGNQREINVARKAFVALAVLLGVVVATSPCADAKDNVRFPNVVLPGANLEPVTVRAEIFRPAGNGPFPAIIVLHGCGGHDAHHERWADRLVSWGYVAVVVDSFAARGFGNICKQSTAVTPEMRVSDIYGTAEYLRKLSYVVKDRIGLLGFSHGGWTIMKAIQERYQLKLFGVRAAVAYYPYCNPKLDVRIDMPLLILMGENDDWTPASLCRELEIGEGLKKAIPVEMVFYPGAQHGFDRRQGITEVSGWSVGGGVKKHKFGGNPKAAEDSLKRTREFFARMLDKAAP